MELSQKHCTPCEDEDFPPLTRAQALDLMPHVPGWTLNEEATELSRSFSFPDFAQALAFADKVGALAEEQWHHPDLHVAWGKVNVSLTTNAIKGLSENDFIMAAKINGIG